MDIDSIAQLTLVILWLASAGVIGMFAYANKDMLSDPFGENLGGVICLFFALLLGPFAVLLGVGVAIAIDIFEN